MNKNFKTSISKRRSAMKRYFTFSPKHLPEMEHKPCIITNCSGEIVTSFLNGFSIIHTKELCDEMEMCPLSMYYSEAGYIIDREIAKNSDTATSIDINVNMSKLFELGYKRTKGEVKCDYDKMRYAFYYDGAYYGAGLFEIAYSIIANNEIPTIYHKKDDYRAPIIIVNSLGAAMILPFNIKTKNKNLEIINLHE